MITIERVQTVEPQLIKRLVQLETEAFGIGGLNEWHLVPLIRHGRVYIARKNFEVIGLVQYMLDWQIPRRAYMFGVSVAKEVRGQGVGTKLIDKSLRELAGENIEEVELTVDPDNVVAVRVYEGKFGFVATDFRVDEYGAGEKRMAMTLSLTKFIGKDNVCE
ncbi:Mycothiol acetyltransferase [Sporomusa carbonis]|uniref:GNAT family N-acetyltransferase n=1 Tax=Sporomusa carbonis TaxID=3076075 RepID=UPI003A6A8C76